MITPSRIGNDKDIVLFQEIGSEQFGILKYQISIIPYEVYERAVVTLSCVGVEVVSFAETSSGRTYSTFIRGYNEDYYLGAEGIS